MKIDPTQSNRITANQTETAPGVEKTQRGRQTDLRGADRRTEALGGKDRASLSERARLLSKAYAALEIAPDVRQGLVNELKTQIDTGNYEIPLEELTRRLASSFRIG